MIRLEVRTRRAAVAALSAAAFLLAFSAQARAEAEIVLEPATTFDFSAVHVGTAAVLEVAAANEGTTTGMIATSSITGDPSMRIEADECDGALLQPLEFCSVYVAFEPTTAGTFSAQLTVPHDGAGSPEVLTVTGIGLDTSKAPDPPLSWTPAGLDFGSVLVGAASRPFGFRRSQSVAVTGSGAEGVTTRIEGPDAPAFASGPMCRASRPLRPCRVTVTFEPTREGPLHATLILQSGDRSGSVPLTGVGVVPRPPVPTPDTEKLLWTGLTKPIARWRELGRNRVRKAAMFVWRIPATLQEGTLAFAVRTPAGRLVATGTATPTGTRIYAPLTRLGNTLLKADRKRRLRVHAKFDPGFGPTAKVVRSFTLGG